MPRFIRTQHRVDVSHNGDGSPVEAFEADPPEPGARDIDVRFKGWVGIVIWKVDD